MTTLEPARARPRAFWADMRFFLGIVLVAASIAGVWFVVSASRQTVPVFAAARTIVPGEAISTDDVRVVDVALGQVADAYLHPAALTEGLVAVRTIESGELVPQSAIGEEAQSRTTSVVLRSAVDVPGSVGPGSVVEVWSAPEIEGGFAEPRILVADATVASVTRDDSMIGAGSAALELVIARSEVAAMLAAMADESALSVVPTSGSTR